MYAVILTLVMFAYDGSSHVYTHDEPIRTMQSCLEVGAMSAREIVNTDSRVARVDYHCTPAQQL